MLSDFRNKKINAVFKLFDTNGNGFLDRPDFEAVGQAYAKLLNAPSGSPLFDSIVGLEIKAWEEIRARCDTDEDGKISQQEFVAGIALWLNDRQAFERYVVDFCDRVFNVIDRNGDERIEAEEYLAFSFTMDRERGLATFRRMDPDGNGYLTKAELVAHFLDFYYSDEPDAPGNGLWGISV